MVRLNTPSPKKREDFSNTEDYIKHLKMQVEWRRMKDAMIEIYKKKWRRVPNLILWSLIIL